MHTYSAPERFTPSRRIGFPPELASWLSTTRTARRGLEAQPAHAMITRSASTREVASALRWGCRESMTVTRSWRAETLSGIARGSRGITSHWARGADRADLNQL